MKPEIRQDQKGNQASRPRRLENEVEPGPNGTKISLSIFKNKQLQPLMRFAESVSSALFLRVAMVTDLFLC
ncbi:hypothetical protein, partial [Thiocystis violacea]|uniref:hypothetical protein n=1 Tax=Thiocystis violacea TaxID=13725 RepID=UPI001A931BC0